MFFKFHKCSHIKNIDSSDCEKVWVRAFDLAYSTQPFIRPSQNRTKGLKVSVSHFNSTFYPTESESNQGSMVSWFLTLPLVLYSPVIGRFFFKFKPSRRNLYPSLSKYFSTCVEICSSNKLCL